MKKAVLNVDLIYPIGSYYETSNSNFDPNTHFGGTWVLDSAGRVTVAQDENQEEFAEIGQTGGSKYMQKHNHIAVTGPRTNNWEAPNFVLTYQYQSSSALESSIAINNTGEGNSENLQPYIVVNRWHRIA